MTRISTRAWLLAGATSLAALALPAHAATAATAAATGPIGNADDIIVTATKVNESTPITASVKTAEPQSIISRSIIEDSVAPSDDFMDIASLTPGATTTTLGNGPGFGDSKINLRGFKDGQYNVTFDGIPFGDSNDPTHHSTAYFPDGTYERLIVDRGPGYATDLGQASYGGNIHIVSREVSDKFFVEGLGLYGTGNSTLERLTVNTGKIGNFKLIAIGEHKQTDGLLTALPGEWFNGFVKAQLDIGSRAKITLIGTYNHSILYQEDTSKGASCYTKTAITPAPAEVDPGNCDAASQIGTYGLNYHGIEVSQAGNSLWPAARRDWNWQDKATDFEVARLQWDITDNISIDNKIQSMAAIDGSDLWQYTALQEVAGYVGGSSPAGSGEYIVAPFSSGELVGLRIDNGRAMWNESLIGNRGDARAFGNLADIRGRPVIDRGTVFAMGSGGLLAAVDLRSGQRVWERPIGGNQTPWVAGRFLFVLTSTADVAAVGRDDGKIKWVTPLTQYSDDKRRKPVLWGGPVLAGDRLLVVGTLGEMLALSPYTGEVLGKLDLRDPVRIAPIIANRTIYVLTDSGRLVAFR